MFVKSKKKFKNYFWESIRETSSMYVPYILQLSPTIILFLYLSIFFSYYTSFTYQIYKEYFILKNKYTERKDGSNIKYLLILSFNLGKLRIVE